MQNIETIRTLNQNIKIAEAAIIDELSGETNWSDLEALETDLAEYREEHARLLAEFIG